MITRIVRLEFQPDKVEDFLALFHKTYPQIKNFEGCNDLELHKDALQSNVFYTKSCWQSLEHLESYRKSDFFQLTWNTTKTFFSGKPQAFSLEKVI